MAAFTSGFLSSTLASICSGGLGVSPVFSTMGLGASFFGASFLPAIIFDISASETMSIGMDSGIGSKGAAEEKETSMKPRRPA